MKTIRICGQCGAPLPAEAPEGLCPACLMKAGIGTTAGGSKLSVSGAVIIGNSISTSAADAGLGLEVIGTADDESTATHWLKRPDNVCDLVIIDIFLKSGSGLGVLQAARSSGQPCKLVVLSNYATPDMRRKCLQLGADKVFDKSNEIDGLINYCARLASGDDSSSSSGFGVLS